MQITHIALRLIIHVTGLSLVCSHSRNRLPPEASRSRDVERALWSINQGLARPDGPRATEGINECSASFFQALHFGQASWTGHQMKLANRLPESIIHKNLSSLQILPWSPWHSPVPPSLCIRTFLPCPTAHALALLGRQGRPWWAGRSSHSSKHRGLWNDSRSEWQKKTDLVPLHAKSSQHAYSRGCPNGDPAFTFGYGPGVLTIYQRLSGSCFILLIVTIYRATARSLNVRTVSSSPLFSRMLQVLFSW